MTHRGLAALDPGISTWLVVSRPPWLADAGVVVSNAGSPGVMIGAMVVVALVAARRLRRWAPLVVCAGALVALAGLDIGIKDLVARPRPPLNGWAMTTSGFSFPSGHAVFSAGAMLMCTVLVGWAQRAGSPRHRPVLRALGATTAFLVAVLVGLSRLVVGVHFPCDVLAGWAIAVIAVGLVLVVTQWRTLDRGSGSGG